MKLGFKILCALLCFASLSACDNNGGSSSTSSSTSTTTPVDPNEETIASLNAFKETLSSLNKGATAKSFNISQINNYYGMEMEVGEQGTTTKYLDDFILTESTQQIGDVTIEGVKTEIGITTDNYLYEIRYFSEGDSNNGVLFYENNTYNYGYLFDFDFTSEYIYNIIDVTLNYYRTPGLKLSLTTNYELLDLTQDGTHVLQYRFTRYGSNGVSKTEDVQRDDEILIENGKITTVKTTMLYALEDAINYQYMESSTTYTYDELTSYPFEKLNPDDFPPITNS